MAQATRLINGFGKMAGWNSVTMNFLNRDVEGIAEISYDDDRDKEFIKGAGDMAVGMGDGNYTPTFGLKLYHEEVVAIMDALPPGKRIQDIDFFDATVQYEYQNRIYKDIIRNVSIKKVGKAVKQGDKIVEQTIEVICSHIDWNQ